MSSARVGAVVAVACLVATATKEGDTADVRGVILSHGGRLLHVCSRST
jgi:hypothetical protein